MDGIRNEIKRLYDLPEGTGIILTPSRYDAQYIPILVAKALNAEKDKLVNIITAKNELGDCTIHAAGGRYFCETMPFSEFLEAKIEEPIAGLNVDIDVKALDMRDSDGNVVPHTQDIKELLIACQSDGSVPILHSIYGSGTGVIKNYTSMKHVPNQNHFS